MTQLRNIILLRIMAFLTTNKLHTVCYASAWMSNDKSLNEETFAGLKIQTDIGEVAFNFHQNLIVFTEDIKHCYMWCV